jgi:hypothetical protein
MNRIRIYCNSCRKETWHSLVAESKVTRYDDLWGYEQLIEGTILQCCGCDDISFRRITHPFEFQDDKDKPEETFFPERSFKRRVRKFLPMPIHVTRLYQEIVTAHDAKLVLLAATGLRSLVEAVVVDKLDRAKYGRNLESKIAALAGTFESGVVAVLQEFREMGNKAVHAQVESDYLDIHRALYVVEGILEYFYGIADSADTFRRWKTKPKAIRQAAKKAPAKNDA